MAQFSKVETATEFVGRTDGGLTHRRPVVGVAEIGFAQTDGHHGTVLSYASDWMELGIAQVYAKN